MKVGESYLAAGNHKVYFVSLFQQMQCSKHCLPPTLPWGSMAQQTNHPGAQWNHGPWELTTPGLPFPVVGRPCPYPSPRRQNVATASYKLSTKGLFHPGSYLCQMLNSTSHPGSKQNQGYFLAWVQGHSFLLTGKTF